MKLVMSSDVRKTDDEPLVETAHAVVAHLQASSAPVTHIRSVDGLRGLACLAVVMHHCYIYAGRCAWPLGLPLLLSRGYLGVEVFFVLSGFCLAYPILLRPDRPDDWKLYARKRMRRILPAYWSAVLLFALLGLFIRGFHIEPFASGGLLIVPGIKQWLYTIFLIGVNLNASFWTLVLEARWYFVFPLMILAYRRFRASGLLATTCAASLAYAMMQQYHPSERLDFVTGRLVIYLPLFALGIYAAHLLAAPDTAALRRVTPLACRIGLLACAALIALCVPVEPSVKFGYDRIIPGGLLAFFLLLSVLRDPVLRRALAWKPLANLGVMSYSLYLIHQPLIQLAYQKTAPLHWTPMMQFCFYQLFMVALCMGCAYTFYLVAERPFLKRFAERIV